MSEFLIPYLIITQFPINDLNVYYGPQYVFNLSHTWVREFENTTGHGHIITTMKCQNSTSKRLICQFVNPSERRYVDNLNGVTEPRVPKYEAFDCENTQLCDTFEMKFNKYGLEDFIVPRGMDIDNFETFQLILKFLNVSWTNLIEHNSDDGLIRTKDETVFAGKCDVVIKVTKKKVNGNIEKLFEIDNIIRPFNGLTWNYKKTRDVERCSNSKWIQPVDDSFLHYTLKSSIERVIMSAHQFLSLMENEMSFILPSGVKVTNLDKTSIALHKIEPATHRFPAVVDPVYKKNIRALFGA